MGLPKNAGNLSSLATRTVNLRGANKRVELSPIFTMMKLTMAMVLVAIIAGHAAFVWAAPNEPEGLGGISDRRRSDWEAADVATMQATCLNRIFTCMELRNSYPSFR